MAYRWGFNNLSYNGQFYVSSGSFEKAKPTHHYGPIGRSGYMIHCVTSGHGIFISDGKTYHVKKGDMFFIQPHKTIVMKADQDDPWSYYWIRFIGNLASKYMDRINLTYKNPIMNVKDLPGVYDRVIGIVEYSKNKGPKDFYYQAKVLEILDLLEKKYPKNTNKRSQLSKDDICKVAIQYIRNHYDEQISVHDLVSYLNIDRTYLYRIFMRKHNMSPQEYINQYRLQKASELLKSPEGTIESVAYSSGFKTYQSFFKMFKKYYAISPLAFREKYVLKDTVSEIKKKNNL